MSIPLSVPEYFTQRVSPDILIEPAPEYHIGGRDSTLEEAVRRLKTQ